MLRVRRGLGRAKGKEGRAAKENLASACFCTDEKVQEANADRDIQKFLASFGESCAGTRLQMAERLLQEVTEKRYVSGVCTSLTKGARLDARDSRHRRRSIASKPQR